MLWSRALHSHHSHHSPHHALLPLPPLPQANFTKDRAAQLAVLFYPIPTAAQLADAEHCLEVWGRLREHHLGLSERVAKRFQPGPVIRGGQWIADNSLKAGSAMMAKSFGSCRENLERLVRGRGLAMFVC